MVEKGKGERGKGGRVRGGENGEGLRMGKGERG